MPEAIWDSLRQSLAAILVHLPDFLAVMALLLLGLAAAYLTKKLVLRVGLFIRLDRLAGRLFAKGDVRHTFLAILGNILGAVVFLIFLDNALLILHLEVLERMVQGLVLFIPNLLIGALILGIGLLAANRTAAAVERHLAAEGFLHAYTLGRLVHAAMFIFVAALALIQLRISREIVLCGFLITYGALGLAFVLAFGLGGREAVKRFLDFLLERREK